MTTIIGGWPWIHSYLDSHGRQSYKAPRWRRREETTAQGKVVVGKYGYDMAIYIAASMCVYIYIVFICWFIYLLFVYLFIYLFILFCWLFIYLVIYLFMFVCLYLYAIIYIYNSCSSYGYNCPQHIYIYSDRYPLYSHHGKYNIIIWLWIL